MSVEFTLGLVPQTSLAAHARQVSDLQNKQDLITLRMNELSQRENVSRAKQTFSSILGMMVKSTTGCPVKLIKKWSK